MLLFLSSLPVTVFRIVDTEASKFNDRNHQMYDAALLTSLNALVKLHWSILKLITEDIH